MGVSETNTVSLLIDISRNRDIYRHLYVGAVVLTSWGVWICQMSGKDM